MNGKWPFLLAAAFGLWWTPPAAADCTCRAAGQNYDQGQLFCIRLSTGTYLARCGMILNNSAWIKVSDGCPEANATPILDGRTNGTTVETVPASVRG